MSEYINDFDEVCQSGSNSTTDRRPATELELEQQARIAELEDANTSLQNDYDLAISRVAELEAIVKELYETKPRPMCPAGLVHISGTITMNQWGVVSRLAAEQAKGERDE